MWAPGRSKVLLTSQSFDLGPAFHPLMDFSIKNNFWKMEENPNNSLSLLLDLSQI